jgi:hypothetical protein
MKRVTLLVVLSLLPALAGCATMVRGTDQEVAVNTTPNAAKVQFSNGQSCTSPCRIKAERNKSLIVTISKEACHTETATMVPTLAGAGVILGGLIDYGTGAVYDLQPNPLTVTLVCDGSAAAAASQPPAEAAHVVDNPMEKGLGACAVAGTPADEAAYMALRSALADCWGNRIAAAQSLCDKGTGAAGPPCYSAGEAKENRDDSLAAFDGSWKQVATQ